MFAVVHQLLLTASFSEEKNIAKESYSMFLFIFFLCDSEFIELLFYGDRVFYLV